MEFWGKIFLFFTGEMECPEMYGWFHLMCFAISILAGILLCVFFKEGTPRQVRAIVLTVSVGVAVLEVYKQIVFGFTYEDGTFSFDYAWYSFPWQFCSMPMYVGLLAGMTKKGRLHDCLYAFLATYAIFAGLCVMFYPNSVFMDIIGINIQTMICHGSMLTVGMYLLYTGYVKRELKTVVKALPVFCVAVVTAMIFNEIAHATGLLEEHTFNMFFISPYCEPSLPVYSLVQQAVPYPWCLFIYIAAFTAAAALIILVSMLIDYCFSKRKRVDTPDGDALGAQHAEEKEPVTQ